MSETWQVSLPHVRYCIPYLQSMDGVIVTLLLQIADIKSGYSISSCHQCLTETVPNVSSPSSYESTLVLAHAETVSDFHETSRMRDRGGVAGW